MIFRKLCIIGRLIMSQIARQIAPIVIDGWYGGYWVARELIISDAETKSYRLLRKLMDLYHADKGFWIGDSTSFEAPPVLPHGLSGIFISDLAKLGKNVVIFQQVTIGSNTLKGHPRCGAPTIGDNVYIGAGAKIIGNITIGNNCRIGANCVVVKDLPPNSTAVLGDIRVIVSKEQRNNDFVSGKALRMTQKDEAK